MSILCEKHLSFLSDEHWMKQTLNPQTPLFYSFNLTMMIGKQSWHLLINPDTNLSRVFKAKYYAKIGFLEANLDHNPSYVWCCIHVSQVVVRRGLG
jgi:hypothetical protein